VMTKFPSGKTHECNDQVQSASSFGTTKVAPRVTRTAINTIPFFFSFFFFFFFFFLNASPPRNKRVSALSASAHPGKPDVDRLVRDRHERECVTRRRRCRAREYTRDFVEIDFRRNRSRGVRYILSYETVASPRASRRDIRSESMHRYPSMRIKSAYITSGAKSYEQQVACNELVYVKSGKQMHTYIRAHIYATCTQRMHATLDLSSTGRDKTRN